jgi:hypothetical protein
MLLAAFVLIQTPALVAQCPGPQDLLIDLKDTPSPSHENTTQYPTAFSADAARRVVENQRVVMWDVAWTPGESASMHFHRRNTFIMVIDGGELALITPDGQPEVRSIATGQVLFSAGGRVFAEQATKRAVRAIVVELK